MQRDSSSELIMTLVKTLFGAAVLSSFAAASFAQAPAVTKPAAQVAVTAPATATAPAPAASSAKHHHHAKHHAKKAEGPAAAASASK
jgi:hypothetical protein